jgi:hypothetical protein
LFKVRCVIRAETPLILTAADVWDSLYLQASGKDW